MSQKVLVAVFSASGVGRSDTALHKNVNGNVKWVDGVQINRPNESVIRNWLDSEL